MGVMRFLVNSPDLPIDASELLKAYLSGIDGRIFPTRVEFAEGVLSCHRSLSESGKLSVPWNVPGIGRPVLTSTSLRDRDEPYLLALELARGTLSVLRDQRAAWELAGLRVPQAFRDVEHEAFRFLAAACSSQSDLDEASRNANQSIAKACHAALILLDSYVLQRMASLQGAMHQSPGLLGCQLDQKVLSESLTDLFLSTFNIASVPVEWRHIEPEEGNYNWEPIDRLIEFCGEHRLLARGGPLLNLGPQGLPEWLAPWKNDFLNLPSFVCDFIETAIGKYQGYFRFWEVAAAGNTGGVLELGEDHRLALVARAIEAARRTDNEAQYFLRIEQPWGEYQRHGRHRLSPFQFADALVRSNLGLSGITLEINAGYSPPGSLLRTGLEISRLIDLWTLLGVQIHVDLACPSSPLADPAADPQIAVERQQWRSGWTESAQADWIEHVVPMLRAKPAVTGVFWSQFSDAVPHPFPHAGLLDANDQPKEMLHSLRRELSTQIE